MKKSKVTKLVYVTTPSETEAVDIGRTLVESHLVACANIINGMKSIYRWGGKIEEGIETPEFPDKGISITLSVFSGRPNPQWWITEKPELEKLITVIKSMKTVKDSLFNYNEWNRLGYASFWIDSREIEEIPKSIHIWRDMAYILWNEKETPSYAKGATELYDMLVKQAEEKGYKEYFLNYHEQNKNK